MKDLRKLEAMIAFLATSAVASAQGKLFDNWNTDACGYTDSASFSLRTPAHLNQIQVWYHWRARESSVSYTLFHDGQTIRTGALSRAECDSYQEAWCTARDSFDIEAEPGTYAIRTGRSRVCQNGGSSGEGFVKVLGHASIGGIAGTWDWYNRQTLVIHRDHTCDAYVHSEDGDRKVNDCRWERIGESRFRLTWQNYGYINTVALSDDGDYLDDLTDKGGTRFSRR
ncbi:MAG: hypothetical protein ABSH47_27175 [Bryobacteraceae bacterium]|jgi:hypothetical protein